MSPEPTGPAVHVPVLLDRVTELLAPACAADGAVLVDLRQVVYLRVESDEHRVGF